MAHVEKCVVDGSYVKATVLTSVILSDANKKTVVLSVMNCCTVTTVEPFNGHEC